MPAAGWTTGLHSVTRGIHCVCTRNWSGAMGLGGSHAHVPATGETWGSRGQLMGRLSVAAQLLEGYALCIHTLYIKYTCVLLT